MLEKQIEKQINDYIKSIGGLSIKLSPQYYPGLPDRMIIINGYIVLVEVKTHRGIVSKIQAAVHKLLLKHGVKVLVVRSLDEFREELSRLGLVDWKQAETTE